MVAVWGKLSNELVVGEASGLRQAVHSLADLNIHETIVEEGLQVVLVDDSFGEEPGGNAHALMAPKPCANRPISSAFEACHMAPSLH